MSWWSNLWKRAPEPEPLPSWSALERREDFEEFVELVAALLEDSGMEVEPMMVRSGTVMTDLDGRRVEWHLAMLSERCAAADRARWPALIASSFRTRARGEADAVSLPDFRLQIFSEAHFASLGFTNHVSRPLAEGLLLTLVEDIEGSGEVPLPRAVVDGLELTEDELFAVARKNSIADAAGQIQTASKVGAHGVFEVSVCNGFYMGAALLAALEAGDAAGEWPSGALVACVSWHHVVVHRVEAGTTTRETLVEMRELVEGLAREVRVAAAERLGERIHWRRAGGGFEGIGFRGEGEDVEVVLPTGLAGLVGE